MIDLTDVIISDHANDQIFSKSHNYKSFGSLYRKSSDQMTYILKKLKQDPDWSKAFGPKAGELTYNQKLMLYEYLGEPNNINHA